MNFSLGFNLSRLTLIEDGLRFLWSFEMWKIFNFLSWEISKCNGKIEKSANAIKNSLKTKLFLSPAQFEKQKFPTRIFLCTNSFVYLRVISMNFIKYKMKSFCIINWPIQRALNAIKRLSARLEKYLSKITPRNIPHGTFSWNLMDMKEQRQEQGTKSIKESNPLWYK